MNIIDFSFLFSDIEKQQGHFNYTGAYGLLPPSATHQERPPAVALRWTSADTDLQYSTWSIKVQYWSVMLMIKTTYEVLQVPASAFNILCRLLTRDVHELKIKIYLATSLTEGHSEF